MNSHDERSIVPVDADRITGGCRAQGINVASVPNSSSSTIKIDSLCIKLDIVKEKGDAQKCRHFSIRGYVAGMRERGSCNFLPFAEQLPPIEVSHFQYWRCQRCLQNCGTANTSPENELTSVCDQSMVRPCARSYPPQDCDGAAVLPFGEGTSGLKTVGKRNNDESILAAIGADQSQSSQEIHAKAPVPQELTKFGSIDTTVAAEANAGVPGKKESNDLREHEDPQIASIVKETITSLVDQPTQSGQQNDYPNGHPRRKARKVRLLKELLCGNTECQQQKKGNSALRLTPRASSPQIKRKVLHDQDQRSVDITTPGYSGKKAKASKGNIAVAKPSVVEHCRDPGAGEGGQNTNKYQWNKHGTQRSSILGKVGSDPVTAWRSIFSGMGRADNQVTAASGASRPTYDTSKGRGTEPYSNLMAPPQPDKKTNASNEISRNPLKSKSFGENSRKINVGGSGAKDRQSDTELGLGLSLKYDPQAQVCSLPSILNRTPSQDHSRKAGFFLGESSFAHRIPSDSKSKEGYVHDVSNRHAPRTALLQQQQQRPYTNLSYGSCSGHQKLDFSDPYKRDTGVRVYSDVTRPHNHERQEKMFSIGRSDEREIVELMAKNQYERSLCEVRSHHPPGGSNINGIPSTSGFLKDKMNEGSPSSHQKYFSMISPSSSIATISMMPTSENVGSTAIRNPAAGFFHQEQVSAFTMFDAFSQCQKQPSSGIWISDSGAQRHLDPCYHHVSKGNNKVADTHLYTATNMQVLEAFNMYRNGTQQNETAGDVFSTVSTSIPFGQAYATCAEKNKGKSIIDLDLNVVAPNVVEEQNNWGSLDLMSKEYHPYLTKDRRMELIPKNICPLDSSYSNEAIPAMQLLSLMDAGKSSHPLAMDGRKFLTKPLSPCYSQCSSTMTGKMNSMANHPFPYSGLRPGVQKPIGSSRHFDSSSLPVGSSFPYAFQTDQNVKLPSSHGHQVYHKLQEQRSRGTYSASVSHGCRPDDSYIFPLPWHATEDQNERVSLGAVICTINRNPADFSTPGPENVYMINVEDLKFRRESSYKGKSASENANGPKRQKKGHEAYT